MKLTDFDWRQINEGYLTARTPEQLLHLSRHWVIARQFSHGTRTPSGLRAFSVLASVIETCRRRHVCSRSFLADVISNARRNVTPPNWPRPVSA